MSWIDAVFSGAFGGLLGAVLAGRRERSASRAAILHALCQAALDLAATLDRVTGALHDGDDVSRIARDYRCFQMATARVHDSSVRTRAGEWLDAIDHYLRDNDAVRAADVNRTWLRLVTAIGERTRNRR